MSVGRPPLEPGTTGEPWVRRRGTVWTAAVYARELGGGRRRISRSGVTEKAARAAVLAAAASTTDAAGGLLSGAMRFRDAAEVWLNHKREAGVQDTSLEHYRVRLNALVPVLGDLRLREFTTGRVRAAFDTLAPGRSVATLRAYRVVVDGVLRLAAQYDAIPGSVAGAARGALGGRRQVHKVPRSLTRAEAIALVDTLAADPLAKWYVADVARFMIGTGTRIGEALGLRWSDVDLDASPPVAQIAGNVVRVTGRGIVRHDGKTAAAVRTIRLPGFVARALREMPDRSGLLDPDDGRTAFEAWRDTARPVFATPDGGWLGPGQVAQALRRALDRTGEYGWLTSHVFRKTSATLLDEEGLSPREIADQLGHSTPRITIDKYLGRQHDGSKAAAALDRAWEG